MTRRFMVAVQKFTVQEDEQFQAYLKGAFGWWHWFDDFWLLTSRDPDISPAAIREKLDEIAPGKRKLVMEVQEDISWSGWKDKAGVFDWLKSTWRDE